MPSFTVNFNFNGGTAANGFTSGSRTCGGAFYLPALFPYKSGYKFVGWATTSSATTPNVGKPGEKPSSYGNVTYYAVWARRHLYIGWNYSNKNCTALPQTESPYWEDIMTINSTASSQTLNINTYFSASKKDVYGRDLVGLTRVPGDCAYGSGTIPTSVSTYLDSYYDTYVYPLYAYAEGYTAGGATSGITSIKLDGTTHTPRDYDMYNFHDYATVYSGTVPNARLTRSTSGKTGAWTYLVGSSSVETSGTVIRYRYWGGMVHLHVALQNKSHSSTYTTQATLPTWARPSQAIGQYAPTWTDQGHTLIWITTAGAIQTSAQSTATYCYCDLSWPAANAS